MLDDKIKDMNSYSGEGSVLSRITLISSSQHHLTCTSASQSFNKPNSLHISSHCQSVSTSHKTVAGQRSVRGLLTSDSAFSARISFIVLVMDFMASRANWDFFFYISGVLFRLACLHFFRFAPIVSKTVDFV